MSDTSGQDWLPADLEGLPEDDDTKYECIDGVLLVAPTPRLAHAAALAALSPETLHEWLTWTEPVTGAELSLKAERFGADVWGDGLPAI